MPNVINGVKRRDRLFLILITIPINHALLLFVEYYGYFYRELLCHSKHRNNNNNLNIYIDIQFKLNNCQKWINLIRIILIINYYYYYHCIIAIIHLTWNGTVRSGCGTEQLKGEQIIFRPHCNFNSSWKKWMTSSNCNDEFI